MLTLTGGEQGADVGGLAARQGALRAREQEILLAMQAPGQGTNEVLISRLAEVRGKLADNTDALTTLAEDTSQLAAIQKEIADIEKDRTTFSDIFKRLAQAQEAFQKGDFKGGKDLIRGIREDFRPIEKLQKGIALDPTETGRFLAGEFDPILKLLGQTDAQIQTSKDQAFKQADPILRAGLKNLADVNIGDAFPKLNELEAKKKEAEDVGKRKKAALQALENDIIAESTRRFQELSDATDELRLQLLLASFAAQELRAETSVQRRDTQKIGEDLLAEAGDDPNRFSAPEQQPAFGIQVKDTRDINAEIKELRDEFKASGASEADLAGRTPKGVEFVKKLNALELGQEKTKTVETKVPVITDVSDKPKLEAFDALIKEEISKLDSLLGQTADDASRGKIQQEIKRLRQHQADAHKLAIEVLKKQEELYEQDIKDAKARVKAQAQAATAAAKARSDAAGGTRRAPSPAPGIGLTELPSEQRGLDPRRNALDRQLAEGAGGPVQGVPAGPIPVVVERQPAAALVDADVGLNQGGMGGRNQGGMAGRRPAGFPGPQQEVLAAGGAPLPVVLAAGGAPVPVVLPAGGAAVPDVLKGGAGGQGNLQAVMNELNERVGEGDQVLKGRPGEAGREMAGGQPVELLPPALGRPVPVILEEGGEAVPLGMANEQLVAAAARLAADPNVGRQMVGGGGMGGPGPQPVLPPAEVVPVADVLKGGMGGKGNMQVVMDDLNERIGEGKGVLRGAAGQPLPPANIMEELGLGPLGIMPDVMRRQGKDMQGKPLPVLPEGGDANARMEAMLLQADKFEPGMGKSIEMDRAIRREKLKFLAQGSNPQIGLGGADAAGRRRNPVANARSAQALANLDRLVPQMEAIAQKREERGVAQDPKFARSLEALQQRRDTLSALVRPQEDKPGVPGVPGAPGAPPPAAADQDQAAANKAMGDLAAGLAGVKNGIQVKLADQRLEVVVNTNNLGSSLAGIIETRIRELLPDVVANALRENDSQTGNDIAVS